MALDVAQVIFAPCRNPPAPVALQPALNVAFSPQIPPIFDDSVHITLKGEYVEGGL